MTIDEIRLTNARAIAARFETLASFAEKIGKAPTQVSRFMGKNPTKAIGTKIAREIEHACGMPNGWMDIPHDDANKQVTEPSTTYNAINLADDYIQIPIYDEQLAAGSGFVPNGSNRVGYLSLRASSFAGQRTEGLVAAHACGDSMTPRIEDGDELVIDTLQRTPVDNQVFAFADEGDLRVKRFVKKLGGAWAIRSDNPDPQYRDEIVSAADVGRIHVIGRVVRVIGSV